MRKPNSHYNEPQWSKDARFAAKQLQFPPICVACGGTFTRKRYGAIRRYCDNCRDYANRPKQPRHKVDGGAVK